MKKEKPVGPYSRISNKNSYRLGTLDGQKIILNPGEDKPKKFVESDHFHRGDMIGTPTSIDALTVEYYICDPDGTEQHPNFPGIPATKKTEPISQFYPKEKDSSQHDI